MKNNFLVIIIMMTISTLKHNKCHFTTSLSERNSFRRAFGWRGFAAGGRIMHGWFARINVGKQFVTNGCMRQIASLIGHSGSCGTLATVHVCDTLCDTICVPDTRVWMWYQIIYESFDSFFILFNSYFNIFTA